ncbi:adaptor protein MecA [Bacillus sp. 1P06AnD]|uniref:adaptor protein MecA n=1 Tax=Bacillus sp. 1P06AnD TaxID=3132208 RepID=UPI00399F57D8
MKVERMDLYTLKIFLTLDDLFENGLDLEDIKSNSLKVHAIIKGMIETVCLEENFPFKGYMEIEIFSLHAHGVLMIISREDDLSCDEDDDLFDLRLYNTEEKEFLYYFHSFECLIQLAIILRRKEAKAESSIYYYENRYYIYIDNRSINCCEEIVSIVSEFGFPSTMALCRLQEYGKVICMKNGIEEICRYFC